MYLGQFYRSDSPGSKLRNLVGSRLWQVLGRDQEILDPMRDRVSLRRGVRLPMERDHAAFSLGLR